MAETKEQKKGKKLGLSRPGKLELKKTVETGQVRQSFSHGRSKMVTVEVRKETDLRPGFRWPHGRGDRRKPSKRKRRAQAEVEAEISRTRSGGAAAFRRPDAHR